MSLIYSVILCLLFKARSCQLQCVKETPNDSEFSINVTTHIEVESGECIEIPYQFMFPTNKVTVPYRKIWFSGDPPNTVTITHVTDIDSGTKDNFMIEGLPRGEYEYGFKLEWECNQTYIFPTRVLISVSALTKRPDVWAPPMTEGKSTRLICTAERLCFTRPTLHWEWTKSDGQLTVLYGDFPRDFTRDRYYHEHFGYHRGQSPNILRLIPTADGHNTSITCVADYGGNVIRTTVTLTVKFSPKILNGSQCMVEGELLVCVCISRGNPLPPITWPLSSLTDFSVSCSSGIQTVNSTITMPAADYHNTSVKCISSNELGQAEVEIPIQNYTGNSGPMYGLDSNPKCDAVPPSIIAGVSITLNLVLLATLIIGIYKRRGRRQPKDPGEVMDTYASLNQADVGLYSVITPQNK